MKKIAFIILSLLLVISLFSCGNKNAQGDESSPETTKSETQSWGNINIYVPDEMEISGGSIFDSEDTNTLTLYKKEDSKTYVMVSVMEESEIERSIELTKSMYTDRDLTDVGYKLSNGEFTGFSYISLETTCINLTGTINNTSVMIESAGFDSTDKGFKQIIESISIAE